MTLSLKSSKNNFNVLKNNKIKVPKKCLARSLTSDDYEAFKAIRLRALKEEEHLFSATYSQEADLPDEYWKETCTPCPDSCFFGLFDQKKLVGIMYASMWEGDTSGKTAYWGAAYVIPEYRGKGLAKPLYKKRENWTRQHPNYEECIFSIIENNERSTSIHKKRGAKLQFTQIKELPGRSPETWLFYKRRVAPRLALMTQ